MPAAPRLAILIPTYCRAEPLELLLRTLAAEAPVREGAVPVLVSVNASPDDTAQRVGALQAELPAADLRLHVQPENVGPVRNIAWLAEHAPQAEYVWVIGDD